MIPLSIVQAIIPYLVSYWAGGSIAARIAKYPKHRHSVASRNPEKQVASRSPRFRLANTSNERQRYYWRDRGVTTGAEVEIEQAICYAEYFMVYKKYSGHIRRVTFWGLRDNDNWRRNHNPLPWNSDYSPKEAFRAVIDPGGYLEREGK